MSAVLYAMVGLPCSGKTTYARSLAARTSAVRFSPDEWQLRLFGHDMDHPDHDRRHDAVENLMRDMADEFLAHGVSVILDFGFWSKEERDFLRSHARSLGACFEIHFMDTPMELIYSRLESRNRSGRGDIFILSREELDSYLKWWQPPTDAEEGLVRVAPAHTGEII